MNQTTKTLHFTISGNFIAETARNRMRESGYQAGLDILETLDGLLIEDQIAILKGDKTLTGTNSEIYLTEESPEIKKELTQWNEEQYGKIFIFAGQLMQPYAYVQSWSNEDLPRNNTQLNSLANQFTREFENELFAKLDKTISSDLLKDYPHIRSLYYAENPQKDIALTINSKDYKNMPFEGEAVILFKQVTEQIPFWVKNLYAKNPYEALKKVSKYMLKQEGAEEESDNLVYSFLPNSSETNEMDLIDINSENYKSSRNDFINSYLKRHSQEKETNEEIERIKQKIIDYADNDKEYGWKYLIDEDGNTLKVPGRAFLHFAVDRANHGVYAHGVDSEIDKITLPDYVAIAPMGLKLLVDSPIHTDCWLGAGLSLDEAYDYNTWQYKLFFKKTFELQSKYFEYDFNIFNTANQTKVKGITVNQYDYESVPKGQRILVIPHLGVEFETIALQCDAIITEVGGKLAHLVIVGREMGMPIIRMENAVFLFAGKRNIEIDFIEGKINNIKEENIKTSKKKM